MSAEELFGIREDTLSSLINISTFVPHEAREEIFELLPDSMCCLALDGDKSFISFIVIGKKGELDVDAEVAEIKEVIARVNKKFTV